LRGIGDAACGFHSYRTRGFRFGKRRRCYRAAIGHGQSDRESCRFEQVAAVPRDEDSRIAPRACRHFQREAEVLAAFDDDTAHAQCLGARRFVAEQRGQPKTVASIQECNASIGQHDAKQAAHFAAPGCSRDRPVPSHFERFTRV